MGLNITFWNCQGVRSKRKELELYLNENSIDIIALNETFLTKKVNFTIPCYDTIRNDRSTGQKGGVAFLVKHGLVVNKEFRNADFNIITDNEALAINLLNLMCNVTGIVYKVEEFRQPISVRQCFNCQCFSHSAQNCKSKQKCVICGENHSHKGCPKKEAKQPKCANCSGPHVASYKGCPEYKKQAFRQHVVNHQKSYAAVVGQNTLPQPKTAQMFQFTAKQLTKFVANVAIQIAQPQVCYPNPKQDMLNLKSSMCRKVSTVAKTILGVNITGKELFESIGSLSAPAPPKPFTFTSAQVNWGSKTTTKPSTSKTTSPPTTSIKAVPKQPKSTT